MFIHLERYFLLQLVILVFIGSCNNKVFDEEAQCSSSASYTTEQWYLYDQNLGVIGATPLSQPDDFETKVVIASDGLDSRHCEFKDQIDLNNSYNFYNRITSPILSPEYMKRGTLMSGLIAARDDGVGINGVAPKTKLVFINIRTDKLADTNHHFEILNKGGPLNTYDISLNTWATVPGYDRFFPSNIDNIRQWQESVDQVQGIGSGGSLFNDNGVLYVFAGGDKGLVGESFPPDKNSNLNAYANFHGVIAVCSVDSDLDSAEFSVIGANIFVCGPSIGSRSMISTDVLGKGGYDSDRISNDYTDRDTASDEFAPPYGGDFSAAIVAGVASLLFSKKSSVANSEKFNWRDVKLILAESAKKIDDSDASWVDNQNPKISDPMTNYEHSEKYGFGLVSATQALTLAQNWVSLTAQNSYISTKEQTSTVFKDDQSMPVNQNKLTSATAYLESTITLSTTELTVDARVLSKVEFVEVLVRSSRGSLNGAKIVLISPNGIESTLIDAETANYVNGKAPDDDLYKFPAQWRFGSVRDLGADPQGDWKLRITDSSAGNTPQISSWTIKIYGR